MLNNFLAATKYPAENVLSVDEAISEGVFTTVYGLCTVFAVLLIIMVCIIVMRALFSLSKGEEKEKKAEAPKAAPVETPVQVVEVKNDAEIIAVITAAICASTGASQSDIIIRSFRRVGRDNSWGSIGIKDQLNKSL